MSCDVENVEFAHMEGVPGASAPSERADPRAPGCAGWARQRSARECGSLASGPDLSQGEQGHAEMLGNLGGLHAGQERRSDRLALRLRDLTMTPLRSISRPLWLFQARLDEGGCGVLQC